MTILATSDLHMQIAAFNYVNDRREGTGSLARISTLVDRLRREAEADGRLCLLVDNGDTLQGGAMADYLALGNGTETNPMIAAMDHIGYDTGELGNHDCDYGLPYLEACLSRHRMPVLCSNIEAPDLRSIRDRALLEREITLDDGSTETFRIGVLSTLPDKTASWNRHHLSGRARLRRPLPVIRRLAAQLRREGADIVLVLAHMGLAVADEGPEAQNQVAEVAALAEVDVVIGGHTHLRFPGTDHARSDIIDTSAGLVHGKPVVQPGFGGSDLGRIDITFARSSARGGRWTITAAGSALIAAGEDVPEDPAVVALAEKAHQATRRHLRKPAGNLLKPMHSFFALAQPCDVIGLIAAAKRHAIRNAIAGTDLAALPLMTAAAATLSGGFDGPENFIDFPDGEIRLRHIAGLTPYSNQVWAVRTKGQRLLEWLERSAVIFNRLRDTDPDQLLIDPQVPGFRFDAIYGLEYDLDPSEPPGFDPAGRRNPGSGGRVRNVRFAGAPLDPEQEFIVATTDHRAGGGGLYRAFDAGEIVVQGAMPLRDALVDYLKAPDCAEVRSTKPWRLAPPSGTSAVLLTSPLAVNHLDEIAHCAPEVLGINDAGFLRVRLTF